MFTLVRYIRNNTDRRTRIIYTGTTSRDNMGTGIEQEKTTTHHKVTHLCGVK